jgi:Major Facilitator Superfamily
LILDSFTASAERSTAPARATLGALEWLNFFIADVQTGIGPFLAAYLASTGWNPGSVGYALTFGGLVTVALRLPAGAIIDGSHSKRGLLGATIVALTAAALILASRTSEANVGIAQFLIGGAGALIGIQILDGVANAIFGVVSILVVADCTRGTGRFNLAQGALATMVGIGAALSNTVGGQLVQHLSFRSSFLGLATIAAVAAGLLFLLFPETITRNQQGTPGFASNPPH